MSKKINKKKVILIVSIVVILIAIPIFCKLYHKEETNNEIITNQETSKEYEEMKNNSTMYNEDATLEDLKDEYKITGSDDIYEVNTENDGRKVINVKASMNYKVAFCGIIKESKPNFEELDSVFEKNSPNKSGIWIKKSDYSNILSYLNSSKYLKSKYEINEEGYLQSSKNNSQTEYDKLLEKLMNGDKQYILNISSIYYMIDKMTGEIIDNPYNELDGYQTYDYCKDDDKTIIFISENKDKKLTDDEIFISIMELLEIES